MKEQTSGTVDKVTKTDNGWYRITIDGELYQTKVERLAKEAHAKLGENISFEFTRKAGRAKEGGGFWPDNLYFEGVAEEKKPDPIPVEKEHQREPSPEAQARMSRFSSIQTAAILLSSPRCIAALTGNNLIAIAEWVEAYGIKGRGGVQANWVLDGSSDAAKKKEEKVEAAVETEFPGAMQVPANVLDDIPF